ncbi:DUF397 domain-containing protein [Streptomyces sp. V2]|uniref:DUF397 domain-containing protein n=1 Tax=Streptomyces sp. V2 TaxID=1424099 RepID=UPI000D66F636|nr:DUF397 domain-containing protein [Streptomyces sp. V2]PWG07016.1 DUF397 domain-containing protein [Streptomyces sp. V2]
MAIRQSATHVWTKSSYSVGNGECVEVRSRAAALAVRDSKRPEGAVLAFPATAWTVFVESVK